MNSLDPNLMAYPILCALTVKAATARELSHKLQQPLTNVRRRLRKIEAQGLIVQRRDWRWQMIVNLGQAGAKSPILGPQEAPEEIEKPPATTSPQLDTRPTYEVPEAPEGTSEKALRISVRMKVPATLSHGEVSMGTPGRCLVCQNVTPMKYGVSSVCPNCARK